MAETEHVLTDDEAQAYIEVGVTPRDLVRLAFPDADDAEADFVLWEQTPFPIVCGVHDIADALAHLVAANPTTPAREALAHDAQEAGE